MYSAEEARKEALESKYDPLSEWSILDAIQLRRIEKEIKKASAKGKKETEIGVIRDRVCLKLEREGYKVTRFCRIPGTGIGPSTTIRWEK